MARQKQSVTAWMQTVSTVSEDMIGQLEQMRKDYATQVSAKHLTARELQREARQAAHHLRATAVAYRDSRQRLNELEERIERQRTKDREARVQRAEQLKKQFTKQHVQSNVL